MFKILKNTILAGLFSVMIIPFIVTPSLTFPYIDGKAFFFRIIVEIVFGLWLILMIRDSKFRPKFSWILVCAGIFTLIMLIADLHAVDPYRAFWSNFERMEGWITTIHVFIYLLILVSMLKTKDMWHHFLRAFVFSSFNMVIMGLMEIIKNGQVRVAGPFNNPIYFSIYFLFVLFICIILLYREHFLNNGLDHQEISLGKRMLKNWASYIYVIISLFSVYFIYLTSRGVLLGLIGGILICMLLIIIFEKKHLLIKKISGLGLILVILIIGIFIFIRQTDFVQNNSTLKRISEINLSSKNDIAGQSRLLIWSVAIKGFEERPILGWGQEGFSYVFEKYYDPNIYTIDRGRFDHAHNTPLDFLIAGGIIGLISYLSIFLAVFYLLWLRKNKISVIERSILTSLLLGYFIQGLFIFDNIISYILFIIVLAYIHSGLQDEAQDNNSKLSNSYRSFFNNRDYQSYVIFPVIFILIIQCVWYLNIKSMLANETLSTAIHSGASGNLTTSLNLFKKALSYNTPGDSEVRSQLLLYVSPAIIQAKNMDSEGKRQALQFIFDEAKKQLAYSPQNVEYYLYIGSFLNVTGNSTMALDYLKKAEALAPDYLPIRFEIIKALLVLGRQSEALTEASSAYDLNRDSSDTKLAYASAAASNGLSDLVENLLVNVSSPLDRIQGIYLIEAAQKYHEKDKNGAVDAINKLVKVNPNFAPQGEKIIKAIWAGTVNFQNEEVPVILLQ